MTRDKMTPDTLAPGSVTAALPGTDRTRTPTRTRTRRGKWLAPTGLILLSLIPILAGAARLTELTGGAVATEHNARFLDSPVPVVTHIASVTVFCLLGAFQFVPALRRRAGRWHRFAGRILIPAGLLAALSGIWIIPRFGWQGMFLIAVIPLIVLLPLGVRYLPNSAPQAKTIGEKAGFSAILRAPFGAISIVFALATMATLFAWYGLGTWLPGLMQQAGYNLGSALTFALTLNLGAVLGSVLTAWAGDRFGSLPTGVLAASTAGAALLVIFSAPPVEVVYLMLVLAGIGTHGTQCLIIAAIAGHYPDRVRGTALGWALGIGRIGAVAAPQVGGWLLAAGFGVNSNFIAFAAAALLAASFIAVAWKLLTQRQVAAADTKVDLLVH